MLFNDMGMPAGRKSNIFSELFMPYQPSDYDGVISGDEHAVPTAGRPAGAERDVEAA